jgi:HSP20 family protein
MATNKKPAKKTETAPAKAAETTALQRRSPFELLDELERWFADDRRRWPRVFGGQWPAFPELTLPWQERTPKVDVIDSDTQVEIKAELPGVKKEDLDVSLTDSSVRISARTHAESESKDKDYVRREISHGEFSRTVALPAEVDGDKATATFKDGILTLVLPKAAGSKRRSVKIS